MELLILGLLPYEELIHRPCLALCLTPGERSRHQSCADPPPWEQATYSLVHLMFVECLHALALGARSLLRPSRHPLGLHLTPRTPRTRQGPPIPAQHGASPFLVASVLPSPLLGCSLLFSFCEGLTSAWFHGLSCCGPSQLTPGMPPPPPRRPGLTVSANEVF